MLTHWTLVMPSAKLVDIDSGYAYLFVNNMLLHETMLIFNLWVLSAFIWVDFHEKHQK